MMVSFSKKKTEVLLYLVGVSLLAGCLEEPLPEDSEIIVLEENERLLSGNLTWGYLNQFVESEPTADLSGTWIALNETTDTFYVFHMTGSYDDVNRYYYYQSFRAPGTFARLKTDDSFNLLEVSPSYGNTFTQHSAGHIEFNSQIGGSKYELKKISNALESIGQLSLSVYIYNTQETYLITDDLSYYEEDWKQGYGQDVLTFNWSKAETLNGRDVYFSISGSTEYCGFNSELISTDVSKSDCYSVTTQSQGNTTSFGFIDSDGNVIEGEVSLAY